MSEIREKLLGSSALRSRAIKVVSLSIILISAFAFSTAFISLLLGSQRNTPNSQLEDAEEEDAQLIAPPFPWNISELLELFKDYDLTQDQIEALMDMFDGDIDNLDLADFADSMLALMFSEIELFRVYNYSNFIDMSDLLWKYECFDEYTGDGWESNSAAPSSYVNPSMSDYITDYWPETELLMIKMINLTPSLDLGGVNSFVTPSLFPTPNIIENSIYSQNIKPGTSIFPLRDDFNCSTMSATYNSSEKVHFYYQMFGYDLPNASEIAAIATYANHTPASIQSQYLQLPPDIASYMLNNDDFMYHYNVLSGSVSPAYGEIVMPIEIDDNAFIIADKIRFYLQWNFDSPLSNPDLLDSYQSTPDGRDTVEWFLEQGQGLWSDFATAFCAFTRAFGIASRFVDGFHSRLIEETADIDGICFPIKYKNLYNWAEIYIPENASGEGQWVQMDIMFDSYGATPPVIPGNFTYNLTLTSNYTSPIEKFDSVNITATLTSLNASVDGEIITFVDLTEDYEVLGTSVTDVNGKAWFIVDTDSFTVAGPHMILAYYDLSTGNYTQFFVNGDMRVNLTSVNPTYINLSTSPTINLQGLVYDNDNDKGISNATVSFVMFVNGTSIDVTNAAFVDFFPFLITNNNGVFNGNLDLQTSLAIGDYEIRADFNGTFFGFGPYPSLNDTSKRIYLNITKDISKNLTLFLDNTPPGNLNLPIKKRGSILNLTAVVLNETKGPISNINVEFYNSTDSGDVLIGSDITDENGTAYYTLPIGAFSKPGPNLIYAKIGNQINSSYYILNEPTKIHIISGPSPLEINRTAPGITEFRIVGNITDYMDYSMPISGAQINFKLLQGISDYTGFLTGDIPFNYPVGIDGSFDVTFGVASNTPLGNYTLRVDFNGSFSGFPNYNYLNTSTTLNNKLKVNDQGILIFNFWINGYPNDNYNNPVIMRNGSVVLTAYLQRGIDVLIGQTVEFYDMTQDISIGSNVTNGLGYTSLTYDTTMFTIAGPHLIYAKYGSDYNYSYFILNAPINITFDTSPYPLQINRSGPNDRTFNIHGFINDSHNGLNPKYCGITVKLFDGLIDVSGRLILDSGSLQCGASGEINVTYRVDPATDAINYTLQVWFNGSFNYGSPYPHSFFLSGYNNFSYAADGPYELKVINPDDVIILLSVGSSQIDLHPTLPFYNDFFLPERFNEGDSIYVQVQVKVSGSSAPAGTWVYLTDVDDVTFSDSHQFVAGDDGNYTFIIDTTGWNGGLHQLKASYTVIVENSNTTYIIINETVSISASSSQTDVIRNTDSFNIFGTVSDNGDGLRGLRVTIVLLDKNLNNVSNWLNLAGPRTITINNDGTYQFSGISINLNAQFGDYYIRIDFNGSISAPGIFLSNYFMISANSSLVNLNVWADTSITEYGWSTSFDHPDYIDRWIYDTTLYVNGSLRWDNGTGIGNVIVSVVVQYLNGTEIATNSSVVTAPNGDFSGTLIVGLDWPYYRNESEILVYYYPVGGYISNSQLEFTDW